MSFENERHAQWLLGQVQKGQMSRREFLGRVSALGIAASLGTTMVGTALANTPQARRSHAVGHGPWRYH